MKPFEIHMHITSWYNILSEIFLKWILIFFEFWILKILWWWSILLGGAIMISCSQGLTVLAVDNKSLMFVSGRRCRAFHYFVVLHQGSKINYI